MFLKIIASYCQKDFASYRLLRSNIAHWEPSLTPQQQIRDILQEVRSL